MKKHREEFFLKTESKYLIIDITDKIQEIVNNSGIVNGEGKVCIKHTTTSLIINEREDGLLKDILNMIRIFEIVLKNTVGRLLFFGFNHDNIDKRRKKNPGLPKDECKNALAHLLAILFGFYEISFELVDGRIDLGTYQRIQFVEFDENPDGSFKTRRISVRIIADEDEKNKCTCGGHRRYGGTSRYKISF
ncbi:YjbQ family protein [Patescibacteria group bacterium]